MGTTPIVTGVDLGGTNVRAAAFDPNGKLLRHAQVPIQAAQGPEAGLARIKTLIETVLGQIDQAELKGIGIGSTGPLDRETGRIQNPYTLPTWEDVDIVSALSTRFSVPVALENDADTAALGEYWQGAGKGISRLLALTIGTGVGTAVILGGEVYRGWRGIHGEGGHHVVDPSGPLCYCGARGCMEILVAGPSIARLAQEAVAAASDGHRPAWVPANLSDIDARMVSQAARNGDPLASALMQSAASHIAVGLLNMITFFVPEVIVLSGSVMNDYDLFEPTIRSYLSQCSILVPSSSINIVMAELGNDAGVYGAAYAILRELDHQPNQA